MITTPVYLRLVSGSSVYGDAINLNYGLFGAQAGGTLVTESFDWSNVPVKAYITLMKWPERHEKNMAATLERLAKLTEE